MILDDALVEVVNEWYSDWHRDAEEYELPPEFIQVIINRLMTAGRNADLHIEGSLITIYPVGV